MIRSDTLTLTLRYVIQSFDINFVVKCQICSYIVKLLAILYFSVFLCKLYLCVSFSITFMVNEDFHITLGLDTSVSTSV